VFYLRLLRTRPGVLPGVTTLCGVLPGVTTLAAILPEVTTLTFILPEFIILPTVLPVISKFPTVLPEFTTLPAVQSDILSAGKHHPHPVLLLIERFYVLFVPLYSSLPYVMCVQVLFYLKLYSALYECCSTQKQYRFI
jgi:hypothetical protein